MATEVIMPRLSDSMEEGTILKWLKQVGEEVKAGEELVEIETDKANMTYEADTDGVLIEVVAAEGDTLPIGEVIARIGAEGEATGNGAAKPKQKGTAGGGGEAAPQAAPQAAPESAPAATAPSPPSKPPTPAAPPPARTDGRGDGRVKASPLARRIARELNLDLASIAGTGPGGRIVKADVEGAAASGGTPAPAKAPVAAAPAAPPAVAAGAPSAGAVETAKGETTIQELTKLQQTVARRMAESKATAPHFYLQMEVDMTQAVALRAKLKELAKEDTVVPSFNDMVVKSCARALREYPRANGAYRDGHIELYSRVNVGVAVAAQDALVVPTVFDADQRSLGDIGRIARDLIAKVRDGTITPPELSGGTFTVSNLGMYGIENFAAVVNPPQAGILAVGALKKKAVVDKKGGVVARDMMGVTLACDHRILYGADGAEFLGRVRDLLEEPFSLAL